MKIQVLGTGCAKCAKLYDAVEKAVAEAGVEAELSKVETLEEIATFGVAMTPGLVIDGEVKSVGKIPKAKRGLDMIADVIRLDEEDFHQSVNRYLRSAYRAPNPCFQEIFFPSS